MFTFVQIVAPHAPAGSPAALRSKEGPSSIDLTRTCSTSTIPPHIGRAWARLPHLAVSRGQAVLAHWPPLVLVQVHEPRVLPPAVAVRSAAALVRRLAALTARRRRAASERSALLRVAPETLSGAWLGFSTSPPQREQVSSSELRYRMENGRPHAVTALVCAGRAVRERRYGKTSRRSGLNFLLRFQARCVCN